MLSASAAFPVASLCPAVSFLSTQGVAFELTFLPMSVLAGEELELRAVSVSPEMMVLLRHHLEASEGLGYLVARRGGDAFLVTHRSQSAELDRFIEDLRQELGIRTNERPEHVEARDSLEWPRLGRASSLGSGIHEGG